MKNILDAEFLEESTALIRQQPIKLPELFTLRAGADLPEFSRKKDDLIIFSTLFAQSQVNEKMTCLIERGGKLRIYKATPEALGGGQLVAIAIN